MPKISELPAAGSAADADELPANKAGTTQKVTRAQLLSGTVPTTRAVTTGIGLGGGGTLAFDRELFFDIAEMTVAAAVDAAADYVTIHDTSAGGVRKTLINTLPSASGGTAAGTTATPHGGIAATNVQGQLEELETEKAPLIAVQGNSTGSIAALASGRTIFLTGNITGVPITAGWNATARNKSGSAKTITPASGTCIKTKDGLTAASVTVNNNKAVFLEGDGTNLWVDGDVA